MSAGEAAAKVASALISSELCSGEESSRKRIWKRLTDVSKDGSVRVGLGPLCVYVYVCMCVTYHFVRVELEGLSPLTLAPNGTVPVEKRSVTEDQD